MSKKTSVEMQLVDIETHLDVITDKIDKLGNCYNDYMEQQTELNMNIYMLLEKLTDRAIPREDEDDNPWEFDMMEEV